MRGVGLIVVDEEHDAAYKQESDPRYDARTVAAKRAALEGAVAVYGSATPRPESWRGLHRISLPARIGAPLPRVRLVDLRHEAGYPLAAPRGLIGWQGGRAILLTDAGSHPRPLPACGAPSVPFVRRLTLHATTRSATTAGHGAVPNLPACGSVDLARIGAGTQRPRRLAGTLPGLSLGST
jgi:primosomal protein N' (replication factor Y)